MNSKKAAVLFLVLVFICAGVAFAGEYNASSKAGDFEVKLTIDKNPPVVGQNIVTIALSDSAGQPVTDAAVRLEYGMAAMPGMPAMNYKSDAAPSDNVYRAPMTLSMAGPWFINVKVLKDNKVSTAKFNVDVQ